MENLDSIGTLSVIAGTARFRVEHSCTLAASDIFNSTGSLKPAPGEA